MKSALSPSINKKDETLAFVCPNALGLHKGEDEFKGTRSVLAAIENVAQSNDSGSFSQSLYRINSLNASKSVIEACRCRKIFALGFSKKNLRERGENTTYFHKTQHPRTF